MQKSIDGKHYWKRKAEKVQLSTLANIKKWCFVYTKRLFSRIRLILEISSKLHQNVSQILPKWAQEHKKTAMGEQKGAQR